MKKINFRNMVVFIIIYLLAVLFAGCDGNGDPTPPAIKSTSVNDGATDVAVDSSISVTFSEDMDTSTINTSTFTLSYNPNISGEVTYDPNTKTATFTPSVNLVNNTTYMATITTGVKDTAGNSLTEDYTWSFTTAAPANGNGEPPTVISTSPDKGATEVAINTTITATFSEAMDVSTINTSTFTVSNGSNISGTVTYSGTIATFTPSSDLAYDITYTATITTGTEDTAGNSLTEDYTWSFTTAAPAKVSVSIWLTTGDTSNKLQQQPNINFSNGTGSNSLQIQVDENIKYQQMDGFGASLTDSSAWLIYNKLSDPDRNNLMSKLFSKSDGIGINYLRQPMGASDFVVGDHYTYDDMPPGETDLGLNNFSIDHDKDYIIPLLKQAKNINSSLEIMGSPWSPPAWIKTSDNLIGGSLKSSNYQVYADYFVKFIQAYDNEGISIDAITIQNEPAYTSNDYPGMNMTWSEQAEFIRDFLGPTFHANSITTKIFIWDHNRAGDGGGDPAWDGKKYVTNILNDPQARKYIAGSAWHGYDDLNLGIFRHEIQTEVHNAFPDKEIYFTERTASGKYNFDVNLQWVSHNIIIPSLRNWAETIILWNIALTVYSTDPFSTGPHNGGCGICRGLVMINQSDGSVTYEPEYYALGHFSKFVEPDAHRIDSNTYDNELETVAFLNPDGSKILVVLNVTNSSSKTFDVKWNGMYFSYTLPKRSLVTFIW